MTGQIKCSMKGCGATLKVKGLTVPQISKWLLDHDEKTHTPF